MGWFRIARRLLLPLFAVASLHLAACHAQETADGTAPEEDAGGVTVRAAASIVRQHRSNAWSVLSVQASNAKTALGENAGGEGMVTVFFPATPDQQYVRKIWVPAGGQRTSFLPFRMPAGIPRSESSVELQMASIDVGPDAREVFRRTDGDPLTESILLSVDHDPVKTMAIYRRHFIDSQHRMVAPDTDAIDMLFVARQAAKLSTNVTSYQEDFLPPWPEAFEQYHTMVLCGDRLSHDAAGLTAIRGWIRDGGRLWVMADRTPPAMLSALLGSRLDLTVVDRVELDQFTIESGNRRTGEVLRDDCEFEVPVDFVRLMTNRDDVTATINGWPAAIWFPFGEGEILLTTLGPRGWIGEFDEAPTQALKELTNRFFNVPEGGLAPQLMETAVTQQIGYSIPTRGFAIALLAACCGCMGVAGLLLSRRNQLEHLAWLVPVIAIGTAGAFIATGLANSTSVPPTIAALEIHRVLPGTNEVRTEGLAAIYDSQSREANWEADRRQWALPVPPSDGEVRRLVWLDDDTVMPLNTATAAGSVGTALLSAQTVSSAPLGVSARFGPDGLEGAFPSAADEAAWPTDAVIVQATMPAIAVTTDANGSFVAPADAVLAPGEYVAGGLLSDEQSRRHGVLQQLLNPEDDWAFPREPSVLFWSDDLDLEPSFPDDFVRIGAALNVVPLTLERTPPDSRFTVPSTFLKPTVEPGRDGSSTAYSLRTGQWVKGLTRGGETVLRFELPAEVRPCSLDGGTLTLRCNIPSRQLEVWTSGAGEPVQIFARSNPSGVLTIPLDAEHLVLDATGGVRLAILVSDMQRAKAEVTDELASDAQLPDFEDTGWQIDYARLTLTGATLPARDEP